MLNQSADLDLLFRALSDPTRRSLVERLSRGSASVSNIYIPFRERMSLPAVVQHLQILEQSGLIRTEKRGRVRTCSIDADALSLAERWIGERRLACNRRLDRTGGVFAAGEDGDA